MHNEFWKYLTFIIPVKSNLNDRILQVMNDNLVCVLDVKSYLNDRILQGRATLESQFYLNFGITFNIKRVL